MVQETTKRGITLEGVAHSVVALEARRIDRGQRVVETYAVVDGVELLMFTEAVPLDLLAELAVRISPADKVVDPRFHGELEVPPTEPRGARDEFERVIKDRRRDAREILPRRYGLFAGYQHVRVVRVQRDILEGLKLHMVVVVEVRVHQDRDILGHVRGAVVLSDAGNRHDDIVGEIFGGAPARVHLDPKLDKSPGRAHDALFAVLVDRQHGVLDLLHDERDAPLAHRGRSRPKPGLLDLCQRGQLVIAFELGHPHINRLPRGIRPPGTCHVLRRRSRV